MLERIVNINEYNEYVDLGLPSGTLWATKNIGAQTPENYCYDLRFLLSLGEFV